ncbi:hypothetical protein FD00_GL002276 [Liquorilactobacillus mali KCTC 3596 = DSM 20444]|uniref:Uncharacterized protein n=2 Tax=Liquorilactobacillus mali TaxID=1618 RepID=A0A0R2E992_9LACO|nr:hypothetical protein FD00_GL002276 [Liquorilactobacillus mali KCTC 3596 = DSM 20444]
MHKWRGFFWSDHKRGLKNAEKEVKASYGRTTVARNDYEEIKNELQAQKSYNKYNKFV